MYAGNGTACGVDTDGDNFPDFGINCQGSTCVADICATLPNTDQVTGLFNTRKYLSVLMNSTAIIGHQLVAVFTF